MDHDVTDALRRTHPAWRLLAADHAALVVSFLHRTFIAPNIRTLAQPELISRLEDFLFDVRERAADGAFPRRASEYLDEWAADDKGWLRKYYVQASDESHFDLTPASEKALDFVVSLMKRQLVRGDVDTHGFVMLDRLRANLPHARSFLMDRETLLLHRSLWSHEAAPHTASLARLSEPEAALYEDLKQDRLGVGVRLEQERISFAWVRQMLSALLSAGG